MKRLLRARRSCVLFLAAAALIGASLGVSPAYATDCSNVPAGVTVVESSYLVVTPMGTSPHDRDALQYAVDCVEPGGTVAAGPGLHSYGAADFVTINNSLTLQGTRKPGAATVFVGGRTTITVDANHHDVVLLDFTMRGPTLAGIQLLGGLHLLVLGIEITDIIPDTIQTVIGEFGVGRGIWAHESILTTSDSPRFHGSITISDCDIRDFVFPSSENAPIAVEDFDQSTIQIIIEDNSVGGTNVLFGIATTGLVTPTTWVVGNDVDATEAFGGLSVRLHPAGIPGEIHIEDNKVTGGFFGMLWFFASAGGSTVHNNRISDSFIGIALHGSNGHNFNDNRITDVVFGIRLGLQDVFPFGIASVPSNGSTFSDIRVSEAGYGLYVTEGATDNVFCDLSFKHVTVPIFEDAGTSSIFPCDDGN